MNATTATDYRCLGFDAFLHVTGYARGIFGEHFVCLHGLSARSLYCKTSFEFGRHTKHRCRSLHM
jgi:hypothetical protein